MMRPVIERRPDNATLAAFAATILIGGTNSIAVRVQLRELTPFWGAALRFGIATLVLGTIVLLTRRALPRREHRLGVFLYGIFNFGITYVFLYTGLRDAPAGTTAVVTAITPLLTVILAVAQRVERFRPAGLAGAAIAGVGIAVIFANQVSLHVPVLALVSLVIAAICFAETNVLVKRFPPGDPVLALTFAMPIGAAFLALLAAINGEHYVLPVQPETWGALAYLVVFASIIGFGLTLYVLARWTASGFAYGFLLSPLWTILLGAVLLGEQVQPAFVLGGALVLAGVYVGAFLGTRPGRRAATGAGEARLPEPVEPPITGA
jgi:O-acetylserine/cysteine efflux transporter